MLIRLRDTDRRPLGHATVDAEARPPRVTTESRDGAPREVFLDWERALDDDGRLRACVACGSPSLYRRKAPLWFTPFALLLAAGGLVLAITGHSSHPAVLGALVALLVIDLVVLMVVPTRLVCYRCGTDYSGLPIAPHHGRWDPRAAARARRRK